MKNRKQTCEQILAFIYSTRKKAKGRWYNGAKNINGISVAFKGIGTWLQIFKLDLVEQGFPMELKAGEFKRLILIHSENHLKELERIELERSK